MKPQATKEDEQRVDTQKQISAFKQYAKDVEVATKKLRKSTKKFMEQLKKFHKKWRG